MTAAGFLFLLANYFCWVLFYNFRPMPKPTLSGRLGGCGWLSVSIAEWFAWSVVVPPDTDNGD